MDPRMLIAPDSPLPYPAPFWFIELFKVLGFALHVSMMNIWYAGAPIAVVFGVLGRGDARLVGHHIARALPFVVAFGVNFGIVPLLFVQSAYYQFFYPATILMAWPWFSVFWLVTIAYFGVYLYRLSIYKCTARRWGTIGAWTAAAAFVIVGFFFANAFSLTTRVDGWWGIFSRSNVAGATTGMALNLTDPTLIPRWLFMFGIALTTTATFVMIDGAFLSGKENEAYRRYAGRFAFWLYTLGLVWFAGIGSWYIFGTRAEAFSTALADPAMMIIFPLTAVAPGLPWLLALFQRNGPTRRLAALMGVAQFGVISLNAVSRQWLQNVELSPYTNLAAKPVSLQTAALVIFLLLFVGGLALIAWMVSKVVEVNRKEAAATSRH